MQNWFECKVKYEKKGEEGRILKVSETYLVEALTFTEAEERVLIEMKPLISGEFEVANIRKMKIAELFRNPKSDRWYRCKVIFVSLDTEKNVEKRVPTTMLVQAVNLKNALDSLENAMKGTISEYEIASVAETLIMDVFFYNEKLNLVSQSAEEFIGAE
jgi:hypothetical protein